MDLSEFSTWVPLTVFLAGVLGSPHCVSMCGPLVANFASKPLHLAAFQVGRMISYVVFGALAGAFGQTLFGSGLPVGVTYAALLFLSSFLFLNGLRAFLGKPVHFPTPFFLRKVSHAVWRKIGFLRINKVTISGLAGMLTVLLPCGHLYTFFLGAVATGTAWAGGLFMFAFWFGSTPLLVLGSHGLHRLMASSSLSRQRWAGGILMMIGIFSLILFASRTEVFAEKIMKKTKTPSPHVSCH